MAKKKYEASSNSGNIFNFLKKSYDDTMNLLTLSRDYFNARARLDKLNLSPEESLIYTLAMSIITTQLTGTIAWLLTCRAIQEGEIQIEELKSEDFRMPECQVLFNENDPRVNMLNITVRQLLSESSKLYNRIKRMEVAVQQSLLTETP